MRRVFIETENASRSLDMCAELESPESLIGPSLGMITGPAGRGKSEFAKHYATNSTAIYVPPMNIRTPTMLLREITFELCKIRPGRSETCLNIIGDEMAKERRLIIIDEADLLAKNILEMLRNMNERYGCSILLIGEDGLKSKVASRRRISSRIRRRVEFSPVAQPDIILFFRKALGISISPAAVRNIQNYSHGDWRPVLSVAIAVERSMKATGILERSDQLINGLINANSQNRHGLPYTGLDSEEETAVYASASL